MGALADMWRRLRSLGRRRELEDRLDDEIRFHVEQQTEKNRRAGMAPDEARRQALIRFGGVEQVREGTRDEFRAARIEHLARDVRYGLRSLRRHPAFSAMAVLSLAIGIGANAAIFGVVHAVLFRDSPLAQPETLVNIYETEGGRGFNPLSHPNIEDLRKGTTQVFSGIAASTFVAAPIDRGGAAAIVMGEAVTGGAFALLGVEPLLGRAILPEDDVARGGHPVVMLSHGYWQRAFGADPQVVGRTLRMGGRGYTIIGVAPAALSRRPSALLTPAFYVPMAMANELMGVEMLDQRDYHSFFVKARLAPGVTRAQAEHAASLVAESLTAARPEGWVPGEQFSFVPTSDVQVYPGVDPLLRAAAWLLMAVVGLVLLLACTNLASFLLARALDRGKRGGGAAGPRRDPGRACPPIARRERAARPRRRGGGPRPGARAPPRSAVDRSPAALRHEARSSLRHRLEGAVRLASPGAHGGRRRRWQGASSDSSLPCREHAPISARHSRRAAEEATRPAHSGGATRWSSPKSRCRSCCSSGPGCS